jgi:hypothetical protein
MARIFGRIDSKYFSYLITGQTGLLSQSIIETFRISLIFAFKLISKGSHEVL